MATIDPAQLQRFIAAHPDVAPAQLQGDLQRAVDYYANLGYDVSGAADPSYYVQAALTGNTQAAATLPWIGAPPTAPAPATAAPPPAYTPPAPAPAPATGATPNGPLVPGSPTLFGPIVGEGDTGLPGGLGEEWHQLYGQLMLGMMGVDGTVRDPITGQVLTGADGAPLPTQQALLNAQQIASQQASVQFQQAALTGTFNGQPTLDAQRIQNQAAQWAEQMGLSRDQLQAQISQFTQGFSLQQAAVTGTYQGAPTQAAQALQAQIRQADQDLALRAQQLQQAQAQFQAAQSQQDQQYYANLTQQLQIEQTQAQFARDQLAEQQRQFNTTQSGYLDGAPTMAAQQLLAANLADPTRTVQGAYLASQFGTARSGQAGVGGAAGAAPGYPTAYGASSGAAGGAASQGSSGGTGVPVNVSPEVQSYFAGDPFATPRGQGQTMDLGALSGYAFKQAPSAYNALSATGRAQVGSFNQALTGQNPADYADMIARQLPRSGSSVPAAYSV